MGTCHSLSVEGRGQLVGVRSLPCGVQIGVLGLGSKLLYLLSHIAIPRYTVIYEPLCKSREIFYHLTHLDRIWWACQDVWLRPRSSPDDLYEGQAGSTYKEVVLTLKCRMDAL